MNDPQRLWWEQAASDFEIFELMRRVDQAQCHKLHYLQMASEKIAKAYFWRENKAPAKKHLMFVKFVTYLAQPHMDSRDRVANIFAFSHVDSFRTWVFNLVPLAYDLEHLQPQLANEGPNCEYPWPHSAPKLNPVGFNFPIWPKLTEQKGRELVRLIKTAITRFPEFADL